MKDPLALSKALTCNIPKNTQLNPPRQIVFPTTILFTWAIFCSKVSALCLLQRIFPGSGFKRFIWGVGGFVLIYSLLQTLGIIFPYVPIKAIWDHSMKGRCIDNIALYLVCSILNIMTDVIILCLPTPQLWRLHISTTRKSRLTTIFALGSMYDPYSSDLYIWIHRLTWS